MSQEIDKDRWDADGPAGLHVVLGATGGAGRALVAELVGRGLPTRAVNRAGSVRVAGAQALAADISDQDGARAAVRGAEVVYLAAQPAYHRWPQEFPAMLDSVINATAQAKARLVMVDNLYAYGPGSQPMREDTPQAAMDAKGRTRAAMADTLTAAHKSGRVRVCIGRASDYFGPNCENSGLAVLVLQPAAAGRTLRWVGSMDAPHSCAFLPDVARALVMLGTDERADGRIWHLPHEPAVTGRQFLDLVSAAAGRPLRTARVSRTMLRLAAPFHRISAESLPLTYQWTEPFVVDDSAFRAAFPDFRGTPLATAIRETLGSGTGGDPRWKAGGETDSHPALGQRS